MNEYEWQKLLTKLLIKPNLNFNSLDWKFSFSLMHKYAFNQFNLISEIIDISAIKFKKMFDYLIKLFIFNINLH